MPTCRRELCLPAGCGVGTEQGSAWLSLDLGGMGTHTGAAGNLRKAGPWGIIQLLGISRLFRAGRWPGEQSSPGGHEEAEPPVLHLMCIPSFPDSGQKW